LSYRRGRPPTTGRSFIQLLAVPAQSVAIALAFLFTAVVQSALAQTSAGSGFVDVLRYDPAERQLYIGGWAAPEHGSVFASNVSISVGGKQIYRGRFQQLERPDVVTSTGRRDWLASGWQVDVSIPRSIAAGTHAVEVRFILTNGDEFKVSAAPTAQSIEIPPQRMPSRRALAIVAVAVLLPLLLFVSADGLSRTAKSKASAEILFGASVVLSFLLLVAAGVTGSSLRLALAVSPVTTDDAVHWAGKAREIRADEWRVLTPMAIGQFNHDPPLPIINRNVGIDGQNMLVIGMTGVPVAHVSALAKPATWGFFLLDLRRALAWHWWFPFFGCFAALWLLLMRTFRIGWRIAAVLAVSVAAAPYSVVFSGWPAYAVFFPTLAIVAADCALRARRMLVAVLYGALSGLSVAGFALLLYPAWQISLAYLLAPFAIAAFIGHRRELAFGRAQIAAAAVAVVVAALLLAAWWLAARDAIAAIAATVYPGQRATVVGGDIDPWFLIKGLLSPVTMYADSSLMNQSDAGSFIFLLLPLAVGVVLTSIIARRVDAVAAVLLAFVAVALVYMYVGFDTRVAEYTLWGRVIPLRLDLAMGLAQVLLLAWLIGGAQKVRLEALGWTRGVAAITALAVALSSAMMFRLLPAQIAAMISPAIVVLSCIALGVVSYLLLSQRFVAAVGIYGIWMVGTALPFNPVGQAPTAVAAATGWSRAVAAEAAPIDLRRVAIIGEHSWTVTVVAAGQPAVNTVMYYPQASLWNNLDPSGEHRKLYNRYQHLLFETSPLPPGPAHQIDSQRLDAVRVTLDPQRFDFRLLSAGGVLISERTAAALVSNPTLQREAGRDGWVLYRVVR